MIQENEFKIPEAGLWVAVIDQAVEDLSHPNLCQAAVQWFYSTARGPGSFRWACDHLDLNASAVRAALNKSKELEKTLTTPGAVLLSSGRVKRQVCCLRGPFSAGAERSRRNKSKNREYWPAN
jgi:hypothetical protein